MTSTEEVRVVRIPEWDLTDKLRKSLRFAEMNTTEMAEFLGVQRSTINNWTSGKIRPGVASLRAWALATGVDYDWLIEGLNGITVRRQGLEPRTRWLRAWPPSLPSYRQLGAAA